MSTYLKCKINESTTASFEGRTTADKPYLVVQTGSQSSQRAYFPLTTDSGVAGSVRAGFQVVSTTGASSNQTELKSLYIVSRNTTTTTAATSYYTGQVRTTSLIQTTEVSGTYIRSVLLYRTQNAYEWLTLNVYSNSRQEFSVYVDTLTYPITATQGSTAGYRIPPAIRFTSAIQKASWLSSTAYMKIHSATSVSEVSGTNASGSYFVGWYSCEFTGEQSGTLRVTSSSSRSDSITYSDSVSTTLSTTTYID